MQQCTGEHLCRRQLNFVGLITTSGDEPHYEQRDPRFFAADHLAALDAEEEPEEEETHWAA